MHIKLWLTAVGIILFPTYSVAHQIGYGGRFVAGFTHPVFGFDHLVAMLSVGILSKQIGGKAVWALPVVFVALMLGGGALAMSGLPLISVELAIAISVLSLGVAIVAAGHWPFMVAMIIVGFFAIFHGHAHGTEMPRMVWPVHYALGFSVATAAIHICGIAIGIVTDQFSNGKMALRYLGAAIAGIGIHLIYSLTTQSLH